MLLSLSNNIIVWLIIFTLLLIIIIYSATGASPESDECFESVNDFRVFIFAAANHTTTRYNLL